MKVPEVTVIMPVYNAAPYLRTTVESLLGQTFTDFELLAIDDGSSDASPAVLRSFADSRLRVVAREHEGVVRTMNAGLALAESPLIARADADDVYVPDRLARQVRHLHANPGLALAGAAVVRLGRRLVNPPDTPRLRWTALYRSPVANPTLVFRREAALAVGGYPEDHHYVDDYPFVSSIIDRFEAANLPDVLASMTVHQESISSAFSAQAIAEADRVRRANLRRLLGGAVVVDPMFYLLAGGPEPSGFGIEKVSWLLGDLLGRFRARYGPTPPRLARWIGRQLFERALLHGAQAPRVLLGMARVAFTLDRTLLVDPRTAKALVLHLLLGRGQGGR